MREREIEQMLGRELRKMGCLYFKFVSPGVRGVPDRIVILPDGHVVFLELKTETGELSPVQKAQIRSLRGNGADVRVVYGRQEAVAFMNSCEGRILRAGLRRKGGGCE